MFYAQQIKITNKQRIEKRARNNVKQQNWTPQKYLNKQSACRTYGRLQKKFGYDYNIDDSKSLKYLRQDFENRVFGYLGKGEWTKKLGRKDKYERNAEFGRPLKKNPLLRIFGKLEDKLIREQKAQGLRALKSAINN